MFGGYYGVSEQLDGLRREPRDAERYLAVLDAAPPAAKCENGFSCFERLIPNIGSMCLKEFPWSRLPLTE